MKKAYITHINRNYLKVAYNLAKSIRLFSKIPLIIYCINMQHEDEYIFDDIDNVYIKNMDIDIDDATSDDYYGSDSGNFYVNRRSLLIYNILCAKTIAMKMALEDGWREVCYLDSDCIATPIVDELFDYMKYVDDYPIATRGIHDYLLILENNMELGNPFISEEFPDWPENNRFCLEFPLMTFMGIDVAERGHYRTTGIMLMNRNCLPFINTWSEFCYLLPKLTDVRKYAPFHEETIYNVLSWKESDISFPLSYINIANGLDTVKHFYLEGIPGYQDWDEIDQTKRFYKIPDDKRDVKVLHGEKRSEVVDHILDFLLELDKNKYFK